MLGLVVHTYSPSHWGGRGGRIICTHGFDSSLGNIARLHLKKKKIYIYINVYIRWTGLGLARIQLCPKA
jgi:hypothetical protein